MAIGQRYSVLVKARNETDKNWRIHANMEGGTFPKVGSLKLNLTGTLSYGQKDAKMGDGKKNRSTDVKPFDDTKLVPLEKIESKGPDMRVTLEVKNERGAQARQADGPDQWNDICRAKDAHDVDHDGEEHDEPDGCWHVWTQRECSDCTIQ